jgi:hypothetical protein
MASYRAQVTVTAATAANITFTKPTGTADGDILIATIHVEDDVAVTPPVGWSLLLNVDNASSAFDHWVFWKRAGSAEGASYLFTHASTWRTGYIEAIQSASADWNPVASGAQGSSTTPLATAVSALASSAYLTFLIGVFGDMVGVVGFDRHPWRHADRRVGAVGRAAHTRRGRGLHQDPPQHQPLHVRDRDVARRGQCDAAP